MLVSIFTPTHDSTYLAELWNCIKQQTYPNFEWVVVVNGPNARGDNGIARILQQIVNNDSRVRILAPWPSPQGVGALKKYACDQCKGDILVEVDHDDLITNNCLAKIVEVSTGNYNCFIFSDCVTLNWDGSSHIYGVDHGWWNYKWVYNNHEYVVNKTHPPTPRSLSEVYYSPDHVRAWSRIAYEKSGGHNPNLSVGDDHDLIIRTYLAGSDFIQIQEPLYIHRLHKNCTTASKIHDIAKVSHSNRLKYLGALIQEWERRNPGKKYLHTPKPLY
jgi:O-antigen biosynthesis protein